MTQLRFGQISLEHLLEFQSVNNRNEKFRRNYGETRREQSKDGKVSNPFMYRI